MLNFHRPQTTFRILLKWITFHKNQPQTKRTNKTIDKKIDKKITENTSPLSYVSISRINISISVVARRAMVTLTTITPLRLRRSARHNISKKRNERTTASSNSREKKEERRKNRWTIQKVNVLGSYHTSPIHPFCNPRPKEHEPAPNATTATRLHTK